MVDPIIILENISLKYNLYRSRKDRVKEAFDPLRRKFHKEFFALKNLNLRVLKGETLGIVGRNGSGKSSFLKVLSSVLPPTQGRVRVNGKVSALLELGSGFNPEYSGLQNIFFWGLINGYSRNLMETKLSEIIEFADIGEFIHQPIKTYSSGMKSRLAFAVSTSIDPEILLLDEVLAVGDALFVRKCYARMERLMNRKRTILFVSHNLSSIVELCTKAILIDNGEILLEGPSEWVTDQYQRLIFSKKSNHYTIREKMKRMHSPSISEKSPLQNPPVNNPFDKNVIDGSKIPVKKPLQFARFSPNLSPKSKIVYKNFDVDISDVTIKTLNGERVNCLVFEEEYVYGFKVSFHMDVRNVVFGMKIKNSKGIEITGMAIPGLSDKGPYVEWVKKNQQAAVIWQFKCLLVPGYYFTNAGVMGRIDGNMVYLNRIVDAFAFQVQDIPNINFGGLVQICSSYTLNL